jgi:ferritin-like metal-binding protein YciE
MELNTLRDLYIEELNDLYSAENQLVKAFPKMAKAATATTLKHGFEKHLKQTQTHVTRLNQVFKGLRTSPGRKKCKAIEALIAEGEEIISKDAEPEVRDAGLIAAAQRVEHYEMAGYGCVRTYAKLLGHRQAERTLQKTLNEEGATDRKLTQIAERINVNAEAPPKRSAKAKRGAKKPITKQIMEAVGLK